MSKLTPLQKRKRTQRLAGLLVGVILVTVTVLFLGLGNKPRPRGGGAVLTPKATQEAARALIKEISIPKSFFEDGVLRQFDKYTPLEAPESFGRANPFESSLETQN